MKLNTSVSKIANSFTYVVSSEKSYEHARTISAVGAVSVISLFTSPATDYGVNNRRIDVSVNITIARIRFTVIVRVVNLTSDKVIRAHWSARRHLLCFAHPSNSARSTIELHRLRSFLESVMGAAIFDFLPKHEASATFVPHTRLSTEYVSKARSKVHLYISRTNCGSTKYCNHFSTINYAPIQLQLFQNNSRELPMRTQTMATVFMRIGAGEIRA